MKYLLMAWVLGLTLLLAGCGGSGSSATIANPFKGTYSSDLTLDSGKTGRLSVTIADSGATSGTLVVSAARGGRDGDFTFTVGTINISGKANNDGTFTLSGTDANSGLFSVTGAATSSGGTVRITAGGQEYNGSMSMGTGSGSLAFSAVEGAGINSSAFPSTPYVLSSTVMGSTSAIILTSVTENKRVFGITLSSTTQPGDVVSLTGILNNKAYLYYEENEKGWDATGGTMEIVARSGNTWTVKVINAQFTARASTGSTGTFTVNGTVAK